MPSLDVAPNPDVWRLIQRIVSRINPKVQEVDLDQLIVTSAVRNLEETGFLPEMRKKFAQIVWIKSKDSTRTSRCFQRASSGD